jgi:hypothetical protein
MKSEAAEGIADKGSAGSTGTKEEGLKRIL